MPMIGNLLISLRATSDKFAKDMNSAHASLKRVGGQMQSVGMGLSKSLTVPLLAVGTAAFAASDSIDKAMKTIRVATGATGDDLANLGDDFREVFKAVPQSADVVAQTLGDLQTRTSLTGDALQGLTKTVLDLSRITGTDAVSNVAALTRVFGDWSIKAEESADSLDFLFKVSQQTGAGIDQLGRNLVAYGAPLRQVGFDFEQAAILLGKFEREGVNTELVLGGLRMALGRFAQEGISDTAGEFARRMDQIKNSADGTTVALETFGSRAAADMAAAIKEGRFEIDAFTQSIAASGETIAKAGEDALSFGEKLKILWNDITLALEPLGNVLLEIFDETLRPLLVDAVEWLRGLGEAFRELDRPIQLAIIAIAAIAAALGPALIAIGLMLPALPLLGSAFAALAGPIGLAAAAIGAAAYLIWDNWETVGPLLIGLWERIKDAAVSTFGILYDAVVDIGTSLADFWASWGDTFSDIWDRMTTTLSMAFESFVNTIRFIWDAVVAIFQGALQVVVGLVKTAIGVLLFDWDLLKSGIISIATGIKDTVVGIFGAMWEFIVRQTGLALTALIDQFKSWADSMPSFLRGPLDTVTGWLEDFNSSIQDQVSEWDAASEAIKQVAEEQADAAAAATPEVETLEARVAALGETSGITAGGMNALNNGIEETEDKAKKAAKELERLRKEDEKLAKSMEKLRAKILNIPPIPQALPKSIDELTSKTKRASDDIEFLAVAVLADLEKESRDASRQIDVLTRTVEILNFRGVDSKQILNLLGGEINAAASAADKFGIELDEPIRKLVEMSVESERASKFAAKWDEAWSTAIGNILSNFTSGVTDMLFEGKRLSVGLISIVKDLAKTLVNIMLTSFFDPLLEQFTGWFSKVSRKATDWLSGLFFGGGANQGAGGTAGTIANQFFGGGGGAITALSGLLGGAAGAISPEEIAALMEQFPLLEPLLPVGGAGGAGAAGAGGGLFGGLGGYFGGTSLLGFLGPGLLGAGLGRLLGGNTGGAIGGIGGALLAPLLPALFSNPLTAIAGAGLLFGPMLGDLLGFGNTPTEAGMKEIKRDFAVSVSEGTVQGFIKGLGLSEAAFEPFRKSILGSPASLEQLLIPAAQAAGQVEQLIQSFSRFAVSSAFADILAASDLEYITDAAGSFLVDMSEQVRQAVEGDFTAINEAWSQLFQASGLGAQFGDLSRFLSETTDGTDELTDSTGALGDEMEATTEQMSSSVSTLIQTMQAGFTDLISRMDALLEHLGVSIQDVTNELRELIAVAEQASSIGVNTPRREIGRERSSDRGSGGNTHIEMNMNVQSRSEDLVATVRDEVIPEIERVFDQGTGSFRETITRGVNQSSRGVN